MKKKKIKNEEQGNVAKKKKKLGIKSTRRDTRDYFLLKKKMISAVKRG